MSEMFVLLRNLNLVKVRYFSRMLYATASSPRDPRPTE
jgi:hypothetical protein